MRGDRLYGNEAEYYFAQIGTGGLVCHKGHRDLKGALLAQA